MRGGYVTAVPQPWELEAFPAPDHTQRQVWQDNGGRWWFRTTSYGVEVVQARCGLGEALKAWAS